MKMKYLILISILILSLVMGIIYNTNCKNSMEGLVTLDSQYTEIFPQSKDSNGNYYLQSGYYNIGNNKMALIPNNYIITTDSTGVVSKNPLDFISIKQDKNGNYTVFRVLVCSFGKRSKFQVTAFTWRVTIFIQ